MCCSCHRDPLLRRPLRAYMILPATYRGPLPRPATSWTSSRRINTAVLIGSSLTWRCGVVGAARQAQRQLLFPGASPSASASSSSHQGGRVQPQVRAPPGARPGFRFETATTRFTRSCSSRSISYDGLHACTWYRIGSWRALRMPAGRFTKAYHTPVEVSGCTGIS